MEVHATAVSDKEVQITEIMSELMRVDTSIDVKEYPDLGPESQYDADITLKARERLEGATPEDIEKVLNGLHTLNNSGRSTEYIESCISELKTELAMNSNKSIHEIIADALREYFPTSSVTTKKSKAVGVIMMEQL